MVQHHQKWKVYTDVRELLYHHMKLTVMAWIIAILLETEFCINVWQARCCCEVIIWIRHTNTKSVPQTCHEEYVYDYASPK